LKTLIFNCTIKNGENKQEQHYTSFLFHMLKNGFDVGFPAAEFP